MTEFDGFPDQIIDQLVDTDPSETAEWQASFDAALTAAGPVRARCERWRQNCRPGSR